MTIALRTLLAGASLCLMAATASAAASDPVAKVGSETITQGELQAATEEIGQQFMRLPEDQRRLAVLSALIDIKALAQEAEKANLAEDPEVASQLAFQRDRTLHNAYFEREGVSGITEEDLKARYDLEIGAIEPVEEYHARHILLETKEAAEEVIAEIEGGADFEAVARERSTGPTGPQGGDLGFFQKGQMVPPFEEAVLAMKPGEVTKEPVETQFGWHVIQLVETREAEKPAFEDVKEQVRQAVLRERYFELVQKARSELDVEYVDPELKAQVEQIEQQIEEDANAAASGEAGTDGESQPAPSEQ